MARIRRLRNPSTSANLPCDVTQHDISSTFLMTKAIPAFRMFSLLALGLLPAGRPAEAQTFSFSASNAPNPVIVNNPLTNTVNVTNFSGSVLNGLIVSNFLSDSTVQFVSATNTAPDGTYSTYSAGILVFQIPSLQSGSINSATMSLVVQPTTVESLTNTITIWSIYGSIIQVTTNLVTQVTNVVQNQSDLAVGLTAPPPGALAGDWIAYMVGATNLGPNSVTNVMLTNTIVLTNSLLPAVEVISVTPTNPAITFANSNLIFQIGTMAAGAFTNFQVTIEPTTNGVVTLSAMVGATNLNDTNPTNNTATNYFNVGSLLYSNLVASMVSTQSYDPQTGLMEQIMQLSNTGVTQVASARVFVGGLTNQLFNATGTNNGIPFVVYDNSLASSQSVTLVLEYNNPTRVSANYSTNLTAAEVPTNNLVPPAGTLVTNLVIVPVLPPGAIHS